MARHVPTKEQRNAVMVMAGLGAPAGIIANGLKITVETLTRVYAKEIANGPDAVKLEVIKQLFNAAKTDGAGRVTAAVKLMQLLASDEKPPEAGAVRKSGLTPRYLSRAEVADISLYDETGTQVIVISDDDAAL